MCFQCLAAARSLSPGFVFLHVLLSRSGTCHVFAACWPFAYCERFRSWDFGASALTSREIQFVPVFVLYACMFMFALVSSFRES